MHAAAEPRNSAAPARTGAQLSVQGLSVSWGAGAGAQRTLREVSFELEAGECLGVTGPSGAGKSQLFLALLGLLPPAARVGGNAAFEGVPLIGAEARVLRQLRGRRIGWMPQDPLGALTPHRTIGGHFAEVLAPLGLAGARARTRAVELLERVALPEPAGQLQRYPHELSGGMRQRALLALTLAQSPALLIADEPTTALDLALQAEALALLDELRTSHGMTLVLVSHDLRVLAPRATRIAVLSGGELCELAPTAQFLAHPRSVAGRALVEACRGPAPHAQAPGAASGDAVPALELRGLCTSYPARGTWRARRAPVLREVDLTLAGGQALGVVGESGSGKSTLVRAALRLIGIDAGTVHWLGHDVTRIGGRELRGLRPAVQVIFQDPIASLDPQQTVAGILAEPLALAARAGPLRAPAEVLARAALESVGLDAALAPRYPHQLSGGQAQRLAIARAMLLGPRLLVCDEPVSSLDLPVQRQIVQLLQDLKRRGVALLVVSHDLALVAELCEHVLVMQAGRIVEAGECARVWREPRHACTRALLAAARRLGSTFPGYGPALA